MGQKFVAFCPQFMDHRRSHLIYDISILMDEWSSELQYIYNSWNSVNISGRPLVVLTISRNMLDVGVLKSNRLIRCHSECEFASIINHNTQTTIHGYWGVKKDQKRLSRGCTGGLGES